MWCLLLHLQHPITVPSPHPHLPTQRAHTSSPHAPTQPPRTPCSSRAGRGRRSSPSTRSRALTLSARQPSAWGATSTTSAWTTSWSSSSSCSSASYGTLSPSSSSWSRSSLGSSSTSSGKNRWWCLDAPSTTGWWRRRSRRRPSWPWGLPACGWTCLFRCSLGLCFLCYTLRLGARRICMWRNMRPMMEGWFRLLEVPPPSVQGIP